RVQAGVDAFQQGRHGAHRPLQERSGFGHVTGRPRGQWPGADPAGSRDGSLCGNRHCRCRWKRPRYFHGTSPPGDSMNEHTRKRSPRPLLLAAFAVPGLAQSAPECDVAAFVANPYGTVEIHADADVSSPIVGKLPPSPGGTLVLLKGARKDWINVA